MQNDCRICMLFPLQDQSREIQDSSSLFWIQLLIQTCFLLPIKAFFSQSEWSSGAMSCSPQLSRSGDSRLAAAPFIGLSPSLSAALVQPLPPFMFSLSLGNTFITPSSTAFHLVPPPLLFSVSMCLIDQWECSSFSVFPVMLPFHVFSSLFISSPGGK